jgi:hypothetical protein
MCVNAFLKKSLKLCGLSFSSGWAQAPACIWALNSQSAIAPKPLTNSKAQGIKFPFVIAATLEEDLHSLPKLKLIIY